MAKSLERVILHIEVERRGLTEGKPDETLAKQKWELAFNIAFDPKLPISDVQEALARRGFELGALISDKLRILYKTGLPEEFRK